MAALAAGFSEQLGSGDPVDDRRRHLIAPRAALLGLPIVWPMGPPLRAVGDVSRDAAIEAAGRKLVAAGADRLPVLTVGRRMFCGEDRLSEAAAAARAAG